MAILRPVIFILGAAILVITALVAFVTTTGAGRSFLADFVSDMASGPARTVKVEGIENVWSGPLTVSRIEVGDSDGVWLTVDDVVVELSRSALLSPAFVASRVAAGRIDVARAPVPGEKSAGGGGGLPLELSIDAFEFAEISLGAALAGQAARISAFGGLKAEVDPVDISAAANVLRIDETEGRLSFDIAFAPDEGRLVLDVEAEEPEGGVVVSLLEIPGLPRLTLNVNGNGTLDDFQADLALALDGNRSVSGDILLQSQETGRNAIVNLNGQFAPFVARTFRPLVAGSNAVSVNATQDTEGAVLLNRLLFESATTRLEASGRYDVATRGAALDFDAVVADEGTSLRIEQADGPPITLGHTTLVGTLSGRVDAADLDATLTSENLALNGRRIEDLAVKASLSSADLQNRDIPFVATILTSRLVTGVPAVDALAASGVSAAFDGRLDGSTLTLDESDIAAEAVTVAASGNIDLADLSVDARLNANVEPTIDHPAARWLKDRPARLSASVTRTVAGDLSLADVVLESALAATTGELAVRDGTLDGEFDVRAQDLSGIDPRLAGAATFAITLAESVHAPRIVVSGTGDDVEAMGEAIADLKLEADIVADPASPRGDLTVDAAFRGQPLEIAATLLPGEDGQPVADPVRIRIADATIDGNGALTEAGPQADLEVDVPDLAVLGPFLLRDDLSGSLEGRVAVVSVDGRSDLTVRLTSDELSGFGVAVDGLSATGGVGNVFEAPAPQGEIRATRLVAAGTTVRDLVATAELDGPATRFTVQGDADGIPLDAGGTITPGETVEIALDRAQASWRGIDTRLVESSTVRIVDGGARLDGFTVALGGGQARVTGTAGSTLDLDIGLSGVPVSLANTFAPTLGLAGTVSGSVDVTGPAGDPRVAYDLTVAGASTAQTRQEGLPPLAIDADGVYGDRSVSLSANVGAPGGLDFSVAGRIGLAGAPAPDLTLNGTVPFSLLAARMAQSGLRLTGAANASLTVKGTSSAPQIAGTVTTADATFIDTRSNLVLRNLAARARFAGDRVVVESASADIAAGGRATVTGTIGLGAGLPADLVVRVADGVYTDGRVVSAEFSADLVVTGPLAAGPRLGGTVNVARADITLPEKVPGGIDVVAVEHRNAPADVRNQAAELKSAAGGGGGSALSLDMNVVADRRIFVRGRGIDAEFGGRLRLIGPASSPRASGRFNLIRGRMNVLGRRLDFASGSIGFRGSLVPDINFAASSQTSAATVTINLRGRATDPEVSISSSPDLPEDEALALLIYDRSASTLSPVQIAQLADAVTALGNGGTGVIEQLRRSIGIDNIDITTDESGQGAAVSVGRYINDRTYVGVRQGTESGSTRVTIDLDITDDIKVRGETGANGTTKGGIFFERDY